MCGSMAAGTAVCLNKHSTTHRKGSFRTFFLARRHWITCFWLHHQHHCRKFATSLKLATQYLQCCIAVNLIFWSFPILLPKGSCHFREVHWNVEARSSFMWKYEFQVKLYQLESLSYKTPLRCLESGCIKWRPYQAWSWATAVAETGCSNYWSNLDPRENV